MIRNIATITNPGLEKDALVIYTDADNTTPFAPEWLFAPDKTGSRDFNGTTDKIVWSSIHDLTGHPVTVSAWVRLDLYTAHTHAVLCANNAANNNYTFYFLIGTDGVLYLYRNGSTVLWRGSNSAMGTGAWVHVLATHDGTMTDYTKIKLYKNGVDDTPSFNGVNGAGEYASTGNWCVGNRDYDNARGIDGKIAQVGLWDRVLTQAEITGLASGIRPNAYSSNLLYYFSGETSSLNATPPDANGTATGTSWSSTGPTLSSSPITMTADLGDGTWTSNAVQISKAYATGKGRHKVRLTCPNWSRLTDLNLNASIGRLHLPKLIEKCHNLTTLGMAFSTSSFIGQFPALYNLKLLTQVSAIYSTFTCMLPTLDPCTQITTFTLHSGGGFYGTIPKISHMTSLQVFDVSGNRLYGDCPSFAFAGTNLTIVELGTNLLSGTLPSFASNTNVTLFSLGYNFFTGTLPDFAPCTKLTEFEMSGYGTGFTAYTSGSFATQKDLTVLQLAGHNFPSAAINNILADCVTSLGISGRVACSVDLRYGTNGAPTGQGITDKATLITAGWTVLTN